MEGAAGRTAAAAAVCVTGAGGFVASWLVERLLAAGRYTVHGTVRDPGDAKNAHLAALDGAAERLRLFRVDVLDYGAVAAAVAGCDGVFHVASPVPYAITDPEAPHLALPAALLSLSFNLSSASPCSSDTDHLLQVELLAPAVTGTMNVLKACSEAKVKRVVVVSSLSAVMVNPASPQSEVMDEASWSDVEFCRSTQNWYCLSKTLAELEAFDYAKRTGLDVVSVCPSLVIGPLLQSTVNASSSVIVDCLEGDREVKLKLRNFVDVRDVADALLLVYEAPEASGRYICDAHARQVSDVVELLKGWYPTYKHATNGRFLQVSDEPLFSSKKLEALGWKFRPFEETLRDSVESFREAGVLD
ncbi:cinnamoyl-CoA reductase 1 isoform X1 [Setaria viridis]|uniref:cinnamoyl-CoA reductase 1 isoform X1 n=1 Tax=Setaria viridis TaxID=4556 RepID=UPI003B3A5F87